MFGILDSIPCPSGPGPISLPSTSPSRVAPTDVRHGRGGNRGQGLSGVLSNGLGGAMTPKSPDFPFFKGESFGGRLCGLGNAEGRFFPGVQHHRRFSSSRRVFEDHDQPGQRRPYHLKQPSLHLPLPIPTALHLRRGGQGFSRPLT